jgi:hypothetical protein
MENTVLIELTNQKAMGILHELEELRIIKVLQQNSAPKNPGVAKRYRGVFSKEDAADFNRHSQTLRDEWNNI